MKQILLALLCSVAANASLAADYSFEDKSNTDWTAFYAGIFGSYDSIAAKSTSGSVGDSLTATGAGIGVNVGYDYDFGGVVAGIEADAHVSAASGSEACIGSPTQTCGAELNWMATIRGRLGVTMDTLLLYGTAGVAAVNATATVTPPSSGTTGTNTDTYFGWVAGAGAEMALTDAITAKLEYNYAEFGAKTTAVGAFNSQYDVKIAPVHTVKLGLNYRF